MKEWYDGYSFDGVESIYSPNGEVRGEYIKK